MTKLRTFDTKFTPLCARSTDTSNAVTPLKKKLPNLRIPIAYPNMSLGQPGVPLDAEHADNFEDIEKQFAVKGAQVYTAHRGPC